MKPDMKNRKKIPLELILRSFRKETTETEEKELLNWLGQDENRSAFGSLQKIWNDTVRDSAGVGFDAEAGWKRLAGNIGGRERPREAALRRIRTAVVSAAAAAAVVFLCVFAFRAYDRDDVHPDLEAFAGSSSLLPDAVQKTTLITGNGKRYEIDSRNTVVEVDASGEMSVNSVVIADGGMGRRAYNQLIVPRGKRAKMTMSDGTVLHVNAMTKVIWPGQQRNGRREIYMEGEAYFDVTRNPALPFVVNTRNADVRVLGTSFNVCAPSGTENTSVVLVSGSVNVMNQSSGEEVMLEPDQMVVCEGERTGRPEKVDVEQYICWVNDRLIYRGEPLGSVFRKLELAYGRKITVASDIDEIVVSGKVNLNEPIENVLTGISFLAPIGFREDGNDIYIYRKD